MERFSCSYSIDDVPINQLHFSIDTVIFLLRGIIYLHRVLKILINGHYIIVVALIWKSSCVLSTFFTAKNNRCYTTHSATSSADETPGWWKSVPPEHRCDLLASSCLFIFKLFFLLISTANRYNRFAQILFEQGEFYFVFKLLNSIFLNFYWNGLSTKRLHQRKSAGFHLTTSEDYKDTLAGAVVFIGPISSLPSPRNALLFLLKKPPSPLLL